MLNLDFFLFLISSLNNKFIEYKTLHFVLICFLWSYSGLMTWVTSLTGQPCWLGLFFLNFNYFFQFYFLKLSWLRILIYNFFQFAFYWVILVFLPRFDWLTLLLFFCLFYYFFQFNLLKLGWLRIEIYIFLLFTFYVVIIVLWPDRGLDRLTQVFCPF